MQLRYYQQDAIDALFEYYRKPENKQNNAIICIPTGGGKSIVIAKFINKTLGLKPNCRFLLLSHVQELIAQNSEKLYQLDPMIKLGIYCAGLKQRRIGESVTAASIKSVHDKANKIGFIHVVIIDECHLTSAKQTGMYRKLIADLRKINPGLKVIGLSATPWRMDSGILTDGEDPLFHDIIYDISIKELIDNGFLVPYINKAGLVQADLSGIQTKHGEFVMSQVEARMEESNITELAVEEIINLGKERHRWLVFCAGINHAEHTKKIFQNKGIPTECITSEMGNEERARIFRLYKQGAIKCLTNNTVVTTGTDIPAIDLVALLRPTKSPGLFIQMLGRGSRLSPETQKKDCLVLDYGGNLERFGPIDTIQAPRRGKGNGVGTVPCKICPECQSPVPVSSRECQDCHHEFPFEEIIKHDTRASLAPIFSQPEWHEVMEVDYREYKRIGSDKPPTLCVTYITPTYQTFKEWVCLNHTGYAKSKAISWLYDRMDQFQPVGINDIVSNPSMLKVPSMIEVSREGKYDKVINFRF